MSENPYEPASHANDPLPVKPFQFKIVHLLTVTGIIGLLIALLLPAVRSAGPAARRMACSNNLKQIAVAMHNYHAQYQSLPPAYTVDAEGRPLHSWRTLLLPFLEQRVLYDSIDLSKPWDDPANAAAYNAKLHIFSCPSMDRSLDAPTFTNYMVVVAANSCFPPTKARRFSEITDGTSNTLIVIEVPPEDAVHWMAPQDADTRLVLSFGPETRFAHEGGTSAALADGSVRFLSDKMSDAQRRAIISADGNDRITAWP